MPQYMSDVASSEAEYSDQSTWDDERTNLQTALDSAELEIGRLRKELSTVRDRYFTSGHRVGVDKDKVCILLQR